jgi:hypothetical protein
MDFGERLRAKVGPLPVWVWGLIAGGLFTVWYWVSQRDSVSDSGAVEEETGTVGTPSGDFSTVPIVPPGDAIEDENTNQEWLIQALNAASEAGVSFVTAQVAISKYLNGQTLTTTEEGIVNRVIGLVGPPPEGTFGVPEIVPDTPEPSTPTKDYTTLTSFSVPQKAKYGQTIAIRANVKWKQGGKSTPFPTGGRFEITVGGKRYLNRPVAGSAIRIVRISKGDSRLSGNRVVIVVRFVASANAKYTKSSSAAPRSIIFS